MRGYDLGGVGVRLIGVRDDFPEKINLRMEG